MASGVEMCAICAWRATCKKMFSISGRDAHCADFTEDVTIKDKAPEGDEAGEEKGS